jgi:MFS family permease
MVSMAFLIPLYLTDMYAADAATVGLMMTLHAGATLTTMWLGGQLADRLGGRWPIVIGSSLQVGIIAYVALLPGSALLGMVAVGVAGHGLGLGLTLAALERTALITIPGKQRGMAAGLFNMIQFGGAAFGVALVGVILQYGLERYAETSQAYQLAFWFVAGIVCLSVIIGWQLEQ